jgi:hypothetical protein
LISLKNKNIASIGEKRFFFGKKDGHYETHKQKLSPFQIPLRENPACGISSYLLLRQIKA